MIGTRNGTTRHQMVLIAADCYRLGQIVLLGIGIKRTSLSIVSHLRVGTHINGAIHSWLQKLNVEPKLVLIGTSGCVIQI